MTYYKISFGIIWCTSLCLVSECAWRKSFLQTASLLFRKVSIDWLIRAPLHKSFQEKSFLDTVLDPFDKWTQVLRYRELWKTGRAYSSVERIYRRNIFGSNLWQELALFLVVLLIKRQFFSMTRICNEKCSKPKIFLAFLSKLLCFSFIL
jgi:hypothetical protein